MVRNVDPYCRDSCRSLRIIAGKMWASCDRWSMPAYELFNSAICSAMRSTVTGLLEAHCGPGPRSKAVFNVGAVRRQREPMRALFDFLPHEMTARLFGRILYRWRPIRDQDQFVALDAPVAALFCTCPSLVPGNFYASD